MELELEACSGTFSEPLLGSIYFVSFPLLEALHLHVMWFQHLLQDTTNKKASDSRNPDGEHNGIDINHEVQDLLTGPASSLQPAYRWSLYTSAAVGRLVPQHLSKAVAFTAGKGRVAEPFPQW